MPQDKTYRHDWREERVAVVRLLLLGHGFRRGGKTKPVPLFLPKSTKVLPPRLRFVRGYFAVSLGPITTSFYPKKAPSIGFVNFSTGDLSLIRHYVADVLGFVTVPRRPPQEWLKMTRSDLDAILASHGMRVDDVYMPHASDNNLFGDLYIGVGQDHEKLAQLFNELKQRKLHGVSITSVTNNLHPDFGKPMLEIKSFWNERKIDDQEEGGEQGESSDG